MTAFLILGARIVPLYVIILLGYIAGKVLRAEKQTIASLLLYVVAPIVVFDGTVRAPLTIGTISLPFLYILIAVAFAFVFLGIGSVVFKDSRKNVLAFCSGTGNTGYFGIPVVLAIFGETALGTVVLATLGLVLYEGSIGFYLMSRGNYSVKESAVKLLRLPTLYAFVLGILVQVSNMPLGQGYAGFAENFRGAYSVLGMMMIGLGLASMPRLQVDRHFLGLAFFAKFIIWPLVTLLIILADREFLPIFDTETHKIMLILSVTPLAANNVTVATELKAHPEKVAFAVFVSTMIALVTIPAVAAVLGI